MFFEYTKSKSKGKSAKKKVIRKIHKIGTIIITHLKFSKIYKNLSIKKGFEILSRMKKKKEDTILRGDIPKRTIAKIEEIELYIL